MGLGPEAAVMIGAFGAAAYTTRLFIPPPPPKIEVQSVGALV